MSRNVALVYVRVSRLDRDDREKTREGNGDKLRALSPATQIEQCKALSALQGMRVEVFEDLHRSGKNTKRPGLERLRERLHDNEVALVAVWSITRLGRSVVDLHTLVEEFGRAGVGFVSAKESIDTTSAYGRAFFGILATLAQMERELTSERLSANLENAARGGAMVGPLPAGYMRDAVGAIVLDPERAPVVRRLFEEYASGRHSFRSLTLWANAEGLEPPQRRRHNARPQLEHFTIDSVRDLVCNIRYSGRNIHLKRKNPDGPVIEGTNFPALIDGATWDRCVQIRRAAHWAHQVPGDKRVTAYPLTGLLRCGACGDNVRGDQAKGHGGRRYMCRRRRTSDLCHEPQVKADLLEEEIRQWLASIRVRAEWAQAYAEERGAQATRATPTIDSVKALEAKLDRLRVSWESGARTDEKEYRREVSAIRAQIDAVRSAPAPVREKQTQALTGLVDRWDEMTPGQRKRLLSTVFTEITMRDRKIASATPHPDWARYVDEAFGTRVPSVGREVCEFTT